MVWNTSHLLARTLQTLRQSGLERWEWELLVIDDCSEDDVVDTLNNYLDLPLVYHRLEHDMGMRGNTAALNTGIAQARGEVVMWSTPEVMLPPGALAAVYEKAVGGHVWVTLPSHGLTASVQLRLDQVDWLADLQQIRTLVADLPVDAFDVLWFYYNFFPNGRREGPSYQSLGKPYGNNQTVGVLRTEWLEKIGRFPYFLDYGSDDPWIAGNRRVRGYTDVTLWDFESYHQWHPPLTFWMAQGKAPHWNRWGHTTSNLWPDPQVPSGGTCEIWDGGDHSPMTDSEKSAILTLWPTVNATGFRAKRNRCSAP
jgi:glycosyltransferase involved in cell wall biosynthesis